MDEILTERAYDRKVTVITSVGAAPITIPRGGLMFLWVFTLKGTNPPFDATKKKKTRKKPFFPLPSDAIGYIAAYKVISSSPPPAPVVHSIPPRLVDPLPLATGRTERRETHTHTHTHTQRRRRR